MTMNSIGGRYAWSKNIEAAPRSPASPRTIIRNASIGSNMN